MITAHRAVVTSTPNSESFASKALNAQCATSKLRRIAAVSQWLHRLVAVYAHGYNAPDTAATTALQKLNTVPKPCIPPNAVAP